MELTKILGLRNLYGTYENFRLKKTFSKTGTMLVLRKHILGVVQTAIARTSLSIHTV